MRQEWVKLLRIQPISVSTCLEFRPIPKIQIFFTYDWTNGPVHSVDAVPSILGDILYNSIHIMDIYGYSIPFDLSICCSSSSRGLNAELVSLLRGEEMDETLGEIFPKLLGLWDLWIYPLVN